MALFTTVSLVTAAFRIAGLCAPKVLASYAALAYLNRTSTGRPISKAPRPLSTPTSAAQVSSRSWDADIVVPIYNNFDGTRGLLGALRREAPQFARIVLVHDCSTDVRLFPLLRAFRDEIPSAILIENERNLGFVQTCNIGLNSSQRDVIILNTDIELSPGALGRMLDVLHFAADIATVTPFSNCAYGVGFPELNFSNVRPFGATTAQIDAAFQTIGKLEPIDIPRGVGFCMAMSRGVIEQIGLFNTEYAQGYGEEADFCLRARSLGARNVVAPNVYVYHMSGQSFGSHWQKKARTGQLRLLKLHPDYVSLVRAYLRRGDVRAVNFAALVGLLRDITGQEVKVRPMLEDASPQHAMPLLQMERTNHGVVARLRFGEEAYDFTFADADVASDVFHLAGLVPLGG